METSLKETHIVGAIYQLEEVVIKCITENTRGYMYIDDDRVGIMSEMSRTHEIMIELGYECQYPKESLFDKLYLTLKADSSAHRTT